MRFLKGFLLLSLFALIPLSSEAALRAILIGDTLDDSIGTGVLKDLEKMEKELKNIAKLTKQDLTIKVIKNRDFNSYNIFETLHNLEVNEEDTLFFFSSSHGFRDQDKDSVWPNIHVKVPLDIDNGHFIILPDEGLDQLQATTILMNKNPKFLISIVNSCNVVLSHIDRAEDPFLKMDFTSNFFTELGTKQKRINYQELFFNQNGTLMISSSSPNQYSYTHVIKGGVFVTHLLKSLQHHANQRDLADWSIILEEAKIATEMQMDEIINKGHLNTKNPTSQTPQFEFI